MVMLLKIAALGLMGFIVIVEARPDFSGEVDGIRVPRHDKAHQGSGAGIGGIGGHGDSGAGIGGLGGLGGIGGSGTGVGSFGDSIGSLGGSGGFGGSLGNHAAGGKQGGSSKVVVPIKSKNEGKSECKCGNPELDEFLHKLSLAIRAYTSKELGPELKTVLLKFINYLLVHLAKEKPNEMAAVQGFLQNTVKVTADANAQANSGGIGGGFGGSSGRIGGSAGGRF